MSIISKKHFSDEATAFAYLERTLWPNGPVCPHCRKEGRETDPSRVTRLEGKAHRLGVHKCNDCRRQFTVKVGTVFEHGRIPLHKMLQAVYLLCSSKKGISSHQLHRILEIQYKSAWFLSHRIREAMRSGSLAPMGGGGEIVEIDETFFGVQDGYPKRRRGGQGGAFKNTVLALVTRGGEVRTFHVAGTTSASLLPVIRANISKEAFVMSDEHPVYGGLGAQFWQHQAVRHSTGEYVRGMVHTNTVEGYFSIFKRGMKGVYQHCKEKHLHRYLAEFDFRYSYRVRLGYDDEARADKALKGIVGKRLTYRTTDRSRRAETEIPF
jgi:transposase-like protein